MTGLTVAEVAVLTGLSSDEIEQLMDDGRMVSYVERGLGPPHRRTLPQLIKGFGKNPLDPAPMTKQDVGMTRLIAYLENHPMPVTANELRDVSGLPRAAVEIALTALRALGLVGKGVAPKRSGQRIYWRWLGEAAVASQTPQEAR